MNGWFNWNGRSHTGPYLGTPRGGPLVLFFIAAFFASTSLTVAHLLNVTFRSSLRISGAFADFPLLDALVTPILLLAWEMALYAIPIAIGWYLAYQVAAALLQVLYELPDQAMARAFLQRLIRGGGGPTISVHPETFYRDRLSEPLLRVGGPGRIVVPNGNVAVTERNGRFVRVLGAGAHPLAPFEYVHSVLDLRQQERDRWEDSDDPAESMVRLVTQDGIQIYARVTVIYRLCTDDEHCPESSSPTDLPPEAPRTLPTRSRPYPFGPRAVRRAAYAQTVWGIQEHEDDLRLWTWADLAQVVAVEELRIAAAEHTLEELVNPQNPGADPHLILQRQMEQKARARMHRYGVHIISARIDRLELPLPVTEQLVRTWQAPREKERRIAAATVEAQRMAELEIASVEQKEAILQGLLEGIQRAQIEQNVGGVSREVVALRVANALENLQRKLSDGR